MGAVAPGETPRAHEVPNRVQENAMSPTFSPKLPGRRAVLLGGLATLTLSACASLPAFSLDEAVRRLLRRSADRAFARLTEPGGAWDDFIARADLPGNYGQRGGLLQQALTSGAMRERLRESMRPVAARAARRAAPVVADAVRTVGIANARAILAGGPRAASSFLRGAMGEALIEAMLPEFGDALRVADDPVLGSLLSALAGTDLSAYVHSLAARANDVVWDAIAGEEADIRADPRATNDPVLIGALAMP
jgi:hypothetical protein